MSDPRDPRLGLNHSSDSRSEGGSCCGSGGCGGRQKSSEASANIAGSNGPHAAAFLLAARLTGFPSDDIVKDVASLSGVVTAAKAPVPAAAEWGALAPWLQRLIAKDATGIAELRTEFIGGLERRYGCHQRTPDAAATQLASSLEYYGLLLIKQAILAQGGDLEDGEMLLEARRLFLSEHLGGMGQEANATWDDGMGLFYGPAGAWVRALIAEECGRLGVDPQVEDDDTDEERSSDSDH